MKELIKKVLHFLSSVLLWSLFAILIIIVVMVSAYFIDQMMGVKNKDNRSPLFGAYVIISPSMVPNINVYDAVVTFRVKTEKIKVKDVITFLSKEIDTQGTPITHRVVGIIDLNEGIAFRTKGDNNSSEDRALIKQDEVIGKVMFRIPMIGYLKTFLTSSPGWLLLVVIPCLVIIITDVLKVVKLVKNKNIEEVEEKEDIKK